MKPWVAARMAEFLPLIAPLTDEQQIAALCEAEVESIRRRPGLKSMLSWKEPLKDMRSLIASQLPLTDENSYVDRKGNRVHLALKYLTFTDAEWQAMTAPSAEKARQRLSTGQSFIREPDVIVERIANLITSGLWENIAAGLSLATGRRLSEVLKFGSVRIKSLYSVWFAGQRKSATDDREYEIQTLVPAGMVVSAWGRLRSLRDFSNVEAAAISSSFGPAVKTVVVNSFADLIETPDGRSELYTHALRAVYPRLCIFYFLPSRANETAYVNALLGHTSEDERPNYSSTLYYMSYKILAADGTVDGRQGIKLSLPGVECLDVCKSERNTTMAETTTVDAGRKKINVDSTVKARFDALHTEMGCSTANETVLKLLDHNDVYRQLEALIGDDVASLVAALSEAAEIKLENETPLDALRAALKDKARFRSTYEKRSAANAEKDYSAMTMDELAKTRTSEASIERWRRAVDLIMQYNDNAAMDELRWFINASAVKMLVGGRGTDIGRYLQSRQSELDEHHKKYGLTPGRNHGRSNIRERVLPGYAPEEENE